MFQVTSCLLVFWEQDYCLMKDLAFWTVVLRAIVPNKSNSLINICHKWKGKAGSHIQISANLPATLTEEMLIECKIDSWSVIYFGGLFILTQERRQQAWRQASGCAKVHLCACLYAHASVCMPVCQHMFVCIHMYTCLCWYTCATISVCRYLSMCACIGIHACLLCWYVYVCVTVCVCLCNHMCICVLMRVFVAAYVHVACADMLYQHMCMCVPPYRDWTIKDLLANMHMCMCPSIIHAKASLWGFGCIHAYAYVPKYTQHTITVTVTV